ncbi:alpha/beta hydrolase [Primorskyibacter sp. S187A]|uniref:alpha/beta fold hydrolase n=1 Tax=Primorskyibacter sp. S187A TaxID=3415130 RepID=UPI003C7DCA52
MFVALGLIALVAVAPFAVELFRLDVAGRRAGLPGRLLPLSRGLTYVREFGPEDGAPYLLVHGLTTPSFVFDAIVPALVARGHRVITYDHFGRGYSDRPRGLQDGRFYSSHINELRAALGIKGKIPMLGYSMGGAIVTDYAARHPDQVSELVLLAPGGMRADLGGLTRQVMQVPLLGDWMMHAFYPRAHRAGTEAERSLELQVDAIIDRQQDELNYRGFVPAVLSSVRGIMASPLRKEHSKIAAMDLPVTAIWGARDEVIPLSCKDMLSEWNSAVAHVVIADAGHGLAYTHAEAVIAAIPERG